MHEGGAHNVKRQNTQKPRKLMKPCEIVNDFRGRPIYTRPPPEKGTKLVTKVSKLKILVE